jgi:hypothetical protein
MNFAQFISALIVISITSFIITWYLALKLGLDWWKLLIIFTALIALNRAVFAYFFPLRVLSDFVSQLNGLRIFGIALFGAGTGFINIYLLYKRFGLVSGLALSLLPTIIVELIFMGQN